MKNSKFLCVLIALVILFGAFRISVMAEENIRVVLNGVELTFDVPPQLINGSTMVPMRRIFEELGTEIKWNENTQTITASKTNTVISMSIDNLNMTVNETIVILDVPPQLINGSTLVPVRAIAESLEADVRWDETTRTVIITRDEMQTVYDNQSLDEPQTIDANQSSEIQYVFVAAEGHPSLLRVTNSEWFITIAIPESYTAMMVGDGNNIFLNLATGDAIYIQMRAFAVGEEYDLKSIVENELSNRMVTSLDEWSHSIYLDVTEKIVNNLVFYYFITEGISPTDPTPIYVHCYFVIWGNMLFEFGNSSMSNSVSVEFLEVIHSFYPFRADT